MSDHSLDSIDLALPAPQTEPERQYYFMARCRQAVQKKSEKLGRPLTCSVKTFGCPFVNV